MKSMFFLAIIVLEFGTANGQTNAEYNPVGVWVSLSVGGADQGIAGNISVNVRHNSLLVTGRFQGVSEFTLLNQYPESHSAMGLQAGYVLKKESFLFSTTGGFAQISGVKYELIPYTRFAAVLEQKIMTRPKVGYGVSIGADITEDISIDHTGVAVMLCLSLGSF